MSAKTRYYRLHVKPGILNDETFGVYAIPDDASYFEYQLASQMPTLEEAYLAALYFRRVLLPGETLSDYSVDALQNEFGELPESLEKASLSKVFDHWGDNVYIWEKIFGINQPDYSELFSDENLDSEVHLESRRKTHLDDVYSSLAEPELVESLKERLKRDMASIKMPKASAWVQAPALVAIVSMVVFYFDLSIEVPSSFPLVGEFIKGVRLGPSELATFLPAAFLVLFVRLYIWGRAASLDQKVVLDQILVLSINFGWRGDDFSKLVVNLWATSEKGWLFKLFQGKTDPEDEQSRDAVQDVTADFVNEVTKNYDDKQMDEFMGGFMQGYFGGLGFGGTKGFEMIKKAKFEKRVHALYYLLRQEDFTPSSLSVYPLAFIMNDARDIFEDSRDVLKTHKDRLRSLGRWIWVGWALTVSPIVAALVWSVLILIQSSVADYVLILSSAVGILSLAIPFYRHFMVVIKKRGWPKECFLYDSPGGLVY